MEELQLPAPEGGNPAKVQKATIIQGYQPSRAGVLYRGQIGFAHGRESSGCCTESPPKAAAGIKGETDFSPSSATWSSRVAAPGKAPNCRALQERCNTRTPQNGGSKEKDRAYPTIRSTPTPGRRGLPFLMFSFVTGQSGILASHHVGARGAGAQDGFGPPNTRRKCRDRRRAVARSPRVKANCPQQV